MKAPILNPVRFYRTDKLPDWFNIFPRIDSFLHRAENMIGIFPSLYYKEFVSGKNINLQFEVESGDDTIMKIYKYDEKTEIYKLSSSITGTDITPYGWVGNSIYSYTINLSEGTYYFVINSILRSDVVAVISDLMLKKKIIQIDYSNSKNDFGCIFDSFTFTNYFSGIIDINQTGNDIVAFESDYGELIKLNSIPKRIIMLTITDVHKTLIDHINMIFSLDNIKINNVFYQNTDTIDITENGSSDIVDVAIKLVQTQNDYFYD